jgi:hypothetical protein
MSLPRTLFRPILLLLALSLGAMTNASAQTRDVVGAKDYPGIGRFGGSVITGYQVKDFDAARMQGAAFKDGQPTDARRLEGRITRIAYRTNPGPSILEVSRNFETQLAKAGFETLLACDVDACGGIPFSESIDALPIPQMWVDGFNYRYFSGRKTDGGRETYASLIVSENNREIYAQLVVAEVRAIENKMVDAAVMAKGLRETGVRLQSRSVATPRRGDRRRAGEELRHRRATATHRRCRTAGADRLQRHRGRPRAEPAGGAGGAVASTRGPRPALAARDNGYDQVQWFQSRNGNCGRRAGGKPKSSHAGADAFRGPFAIAASRYHRRALSIVQR